MVVHERVRAFDKRQDRLRNRLALSVEVSENEHPQQIRTSSHAAGCLVGGHRSQVRRSNRTGTSILHRLESRPQLSSILQWQVPKGGMILRSRLR